MRWAVPVIRQSGPRIWIVWQRTGFASRVRTASSPVCIPTRVSMFSGQYPHSVGKTAHVRMRIDPRVQMLPQLFRDGGYRTGIIGKTHFWPVDELYGAEYGRLTIDRHLSPELAENDAYVAYLRAQGLDHITDESQFPPEHYRTNWTAREVDEFMNMDDSRPFFLFSSFVNPHPPFDPPEPYASMYRDAALPPPVVREEEFSTRPLFVRSRMDRDLLSDSRPLRRMKEKYLALITMVDEAVGTIVDSLRASGCDCWTSRFDLDDFARSFAPEVDHNSVAVLDRNGNLILRVGRYGNYDDEVPLVKDGASPHARSLGGDEVGLFHASYVGTHTDRRLYISDAGNMRILSVKLGYHAEETVALKNVPDRGKP